MLNCVVLNGRLVNDPELKTTASGISVVSFTIAVARDFVKAREERQADFIDIVAWRNTAEFISKFFFKGSLIAVQGVLQTRMYEDKNGNKRKAVEVVADKVNFCGSKPNENTTTGARAEGRGKSTVENTDADDFETVAEDDLPF